MANSGRMPEGVKMAIYWALGIGIIALILLVMTILFGNLSGNVGFGRESTSFINETINLTTAGEIPTTAAGRVDPALTNVLVINATGAETVNSGNYTITGATISSVTPEYNDTLVNVTATVTYDSQGLIDTDGIIHNYTKSATNVSAQLPTVGTIIGVAILLAVLLGVLIFAIRKMLGITKEAGGVGGKGGNFGESKASFG